MAGGRVQRRPRARPQPPAPRRAARAARRSIPPRTRNVLATAAELRDEAEVLEQAVDEALERLGAGGSPAGGRGARGWRAAAGRCGGWSLRRLAEQAAGGPRAARTGGRVDAIERLAAARRAAARSTSAAACGRSASTGSSASGADAGAPPCRAGRAGGARAVPLRRLGGGLRASSPEPGDARARLARRAGAGRATCSRAPSRSARWRDGRPHEPARPGRARSRSRTCSPTARCRARCAARCRWSSPDGEIAWVAGVAVSERLQGRPSARRPAVAPATPDDRAGRACDLRLPGPCPT